MTALGASFTRWRAEALGLEYRAAFARLCDLGLAVIRLSASWQEVASFGWTHLDWLMDHAGAVEQPVVLTVGMKALGWPEFYLPAGLDWEDPQLERQAIRQVSAIVERFAGHPTLAAWQIENEPFNRSGPNRRWLARSLVRREANAVRRLDRRRPLIVTCFGHFNDGLDRASARSQPGWRERLRLDVAAEREALAVLRPGDVLGVDVYRSIGWVDEAGDERISHADPDQLDDLSRWQRITREQHKRLWVTEAQAEPWEARPQTHAAPRTVSPADVTRIIDELGATRVEAVLLWGSEYWLWREREGDPRWIEAVALGRRALA